MVNANMQLVRVRDVLGEFSETSANEEEELTSRDISSNVTHSGDIDAMQHIRSLNYVVIRSQGGFCLLLFKPFSA